MSVVIPFSQACERNKYVILDVIQPYLKQVDSVLEIGSGTAQHAIYFAGQHPNMKWQTSDQLSYLEGINAQIENAQLANVLPPVELDVNQSQWLPEGILFPAVYTANTFHIMSRGDVVAFFDGLPKVTAPDAFLFVYGPFKYDGFFTSASNQLFDQTLRSHDKGSCIKDFEWINRLALEANFSLISDQDMPANNQCIVWQRKEK